MSTVATRSETAPAPRRGGFWRRPAFAASFVVLAAVTLANSVYLSGLRSPDPVLYRSGLGPPAHDAHPGYTTIDPNDGWTVEALGRAAARQWANGHVPLWNSYEGLGQPLAGEMQSAALFQPFIMLQLLPHGVFVMHLVLEVIAGLTTMFFLRHLRLGWLAPCVGGCLFAVNGAFAVMTNAPFNPIAFLPMGLLGVEMIRARVRERRPPWSGVVVLALALGWMLLAGFPETAFLEGLFIGCWSLMRLVQARGRRRSLAGWTTAGLALGLALAAPVLVAFLDFMSWGTTSYHEGVANNASYSVRQITSLALPYATGALGNSVMQLQAGYLTLPALMMALVGLTGTQRRGIRVLLTTTIVVLIGNMFGFTPIKAVLNHLPGIKAILVYKYGISILEFAVVVAVALALDDMRTRRISRARVVACGLSTAAYAAVSTVVLIVSGDVDDPLWTTCALGALTVVCGVLWILLRNAATKLSPRASRSASAAPPAGARRLATAGALLTLTAIGHYVVPQKAARAPSAIDEAPVTFLQHHLGTSRFYTLGPIQPNYGSYWSLGQLNVNDLPVPRRYGQLVLDELRPSEAGLTATQLLDNFKEYQLVPFNPAPAVQRKLLTGYGQKQAAFREAGVRFVVTRPRVVDPAQAEAMGLRRVLRSARTEIFEDRAAQPYYTTDGDCRVRTQSRSEVTLTCARPGSLIRRELAAPGWRATLDGRDRPITSSTRGLYQRVAVPAGTTHITFDYRPRHFALAAWCTAAAAAIMVLGCAVPRIGALRTRRSVIRPNRASTGSTACPTPEEK